LLSHCLLMRQKTNTKQYRSKARNSNGMYHVIRVAMRLFKNREVEVLGAI
jgi:hypothetical protein